MDSEDLWPRPRAPAHGRMSCVRRFVRGRGVRPRQGLPHAGGPPALRVHPGLRGAPGAPTGLRLRRRHLPRRVRAARRALPRPPRPARHVPGPLPQYVGAGPAGGGASGRPSAPGRRAGGRGLQGLEPRRVGLGAGAGLVVGGAWAARSWAESNKGSLHATERVSVGWVFCGMEKSRVEVWKGGSGAHVGCEVWVLDSGA